MPVHSGAREGNKPKVDDAVPLPPLALSIVQDALATSKPGEPLLVGAANFCKGYPSPARQQSSGVL